MHREYVIWHIAKREGYRLEKKGDGSYRLINARFNVAVYHLDGVPLERIAAFLARPKAEKIRRMLNIVRQHTSEARANIRQHGP